MIEQEVVETPVEEKNMAKLAEILRERGVNVLQALEADDVGPTALTFLCEDEFNAAEVADTVIELGYPLVSLSRHWAYRSTVRLLPFWSMRFRTAK